jgi:hypothetical protein
VLTLITGDKVTVAQGPGEAVSVEDIERTPGASGSIRVAREDGDTFGYPDEAMPYVATGRLDKQWPRRTRGSTAGRPSPTRWAIGHAAYRVITPVVLGSDAGEDAVTSLKLAVSYDDGASRRRQDLSEKKGTWRTVLNAPARTGYLSIRVTADQRNGCGITQTVIRAFGLK